MKPGGEQAPAPLDEGARARAQARQGRLTKPPGALGRLEEIAIRLAAMQGTDRPEIEHIHISVFAADHGIAAEGVSAFPQAVTAEMLKNFAGGGAAISVLARHLGATLEVIDLGTAAGPASIPGVRAHRLGPGTRNMLAQPAMTGEQCAAALEIGRQSVERARQGNAQLFIGGEMGIGNTTAATALACALIGSDPETLAGPGSGLDAAGVHHKTEIIHRVLRRHRAHGGEPLAILRLMGGFEIAALAGSYLACARAGMPALIDGFISSVAALLADRLLGGGARWFLFSHTSAEPGHKFVLEAMEAKPLLALGLRLGEGSGAAAAVPLLRLACALHNDMATFEEAGVSGRLS